MPFLSTQTTANSSLWSRIVSEFNDEHGRQFILGWVLTLASYIVTAQLGVYLYRDIGTFPALIWPPVGIALAAMILGGYRMWSAVAIASFANGVLNHAPFFLIVATSFASTLQPIVGTYILRFFNFDAILGKTKDVFLLLCVGLFTSGIMPILNYGFVEAYNNLFNAARELPSWHTIWIGGALSAQIGRAHV